MNKTPNSLRKHIGIFGDTNSGKSQLFNKIINQDLAVVSDKEGTTTDPVKKAMELIGFGPVVFVDTAGTNDFTELGNLRNKKTFDVLTEVDYALIICDFKKYNKVTLDKIKETLSKNNTPYTIVISKEDTLNDEEKENAKKEFKDAIFVSSFDEVSIDKLKEHLILKLKKEEEEQGLLNGICKAGDDVVLVVPSDSEAPKGRLILPQVQTIRDCLDNNIYCHITNEENLSKLLLDLKKVDLVITDSQAFKNVNEIVPKNIRLTSFSMLLARQKGDFKTLYEGALFIERLKNNDKILISEVCTHNTSHEDIARVKIPNLLKKVTGLNLEFEFTSGQDFPENLTDYSLIIHCGGCMITKKAMGKRLGKIKEKNIPVTNFGVALSYLTGAYKRQEFLKNL
ncbi:MAG: [FeFe] hydrogenase H-cluster maturation GTPase HydF [Ruminococcaceae bacterium]|nr:[FeFe] hydrogenase H-cluster maturation GTPase HydF [Oscillospiraceae bacterium]